MANADNIAKRLRLIADPAIAVADLQKALESYMTEVLNSRNLKKNLAKGMHGHGRHCNPRYDSLAIVAPLFQKFE